MSPCRRPRVIAVVPRSRSSGVRHRAVCLCGCLFTLCLPPRQCCGQGLGGGTHCLTCWKPKESLPAQSGGGQGHVLVRALRLPAPPGNLQINWFTVNMFSVCTFLPALALSPPCHLSAFASLSLTHTSTNILS